MNVGGVAVLLDNLLTNLDKNQFQGLLLTGVCEAPEGEYLEGRTQNYEVKQIPNFHKSITLVDDVKAAVEIAKIIRNFNPDIVHTHTSKAGLFGRVIAVLVAPKAKRIHTFHGHLLVGYFNSFKLMIVKTFEKSLGVLTDRFVAMGTQVRDDLVAVGIGNLDKFEVFFPGLATPIFPAKSEAVREINLDPNKVYCTFIGRLTGIKRPERVLQVAELVQSQNSNVAFLVVGDGDLASQLKDESKSKNLPITFLGWRQDIPTILAASDMLLLTSDNEAVALTLIEATQAQIPVITTPAGSVRDVAVNGENGIVTNFDPRELADGVLKLSLDPDLRNSMGAAGKTRSEKMFSIERMVTDHENLYKKLLRE
jgi:glycosyltransferase involved in cell wall biosynthesis